MRRKLHIPHPPTPGVCWLCGGDRQVEWSGVDDEGNVVMGLYNPCPVCADKLDAVATPDDGS